jgi:hypothetical protein
MDPKLFVNETDSENKTLYCLTYFIYGYEVELSIVNNEYMYTKKPIYHKCAEICYN